MRYLSTRNKLDFFSLSQAMQSGLAPDGGLFIPETIPIITNQLDLADLNFTEFSSQLLDGFFVNDLLKLELNNICKKVFNFPIPTLKINRNTFVLELFHGPTCSFKDFGARFLAECLNLIEDDKKIILVATSGDTGSAVASAFYQKKNYQVIILYPQGQISAKQEQQITCWDENIFSFAIHGTFDQCQQLVKLAFQDLNCQAITKLGSANSINIGRLLPQMTYYAYSSLQFYLKNKQEPGFIIPSGNLGNATAAYWAKAMGFPIRRIVLATNANRVISDYLTNGHYNPKQSITTIANAMDVGNPSNFERLKHLFISFKDFYNHVTAIAVDDSLIYNTIAHIYKQYNYICCPHTATAFYVRNHLDNGPWIIASTADPAKFDNIIEPIISSPIAVVPQLLNLLDKPNKIFKLEPNLQALQKVLSSISS
ncbi:threonine synthase [Legionella sp. D16C41]|uniref:threonine synthase n=1 Tax=Legionella sp. D16C41 TaxID=3402688 RepID=UPI003AF74FFA